jgi:hypothetical protein
MLLSGVYFQGLICGTNDRVFISTMYFFFSGGGLDAMLRLD